ncbi:MAG TPA: alpha/beta hydrolase [Acidimicrobiales bacterium]|nr:alpha/beta hydrolase [Acidimicrobiales bacterium]
MAHFDHDGIRIHYEDTGGDGLPILWSHGFLMDHTMFDPQVAGLDGYRHIRWDERGFGDTDAAGPFSYWDSAEDAIALLDHLDIDRAVLAGMSQGGFLSLRAALAHPGRVRALILIDTQSGTEDPENVESYRGMIEAVSTGDEETRSGVFDIVGGLIIDDPDLQPEWKAKWMAEDPARIVDPGGALLDRDDITERLGEITCPVLIVHGTADTAIPIEKAELLRAELPDCRDLVPIEGAAHAPNLTHPAEVNRHIERFLEAL